MQATGFESTADCDSKAETSYKLRKTHRPQREINIYCVTINKKNCRKISFK